MKYAIVRIDGVVEVKEDSSSDLPQGAIQLTDENYQKLTSGNYALVNGEIVPYTPPPAEISVRQEILDVSQKALASGFLHVVMLDIMTRYIESVQQKVNLYYESINQTAPTITESDLIDQNSEFYSHPYVETKSYYDQLIALQEQK